MVKKKKKVSGKRNMWFAERKGKWSFVPMNWKGWIALWVLILLNVFSGYYFDVMNSPFIQISKFLVVFLLSLVVFILISRRKTVGGKYDN
jgi:hypothetical protein